MNVMKKAWQIAKEAVKKFGGKAREYFSAALKEAWSMKKFERTVIAAYTKKGLFANNMTIQIVKAKFALVSAGNCTKRFMFDGDDIVERAIAATENSHWGKCQTVFERGIEGYGIWTEGSDYVVDVYANIEAAIKHGIVGDAERVS